MNVVEIVKQALLHAGVDWILWLLALLSVASLGVALERWWYLRKRHADLRVLAAQLDRDLAAGDLAVAIANLQNRGVAAAIAVAGLRLAHLGPVAAEKAMNSAMALQRAQLERGLAYLATLGNNAPLSGCSAPSLVSLKRLKNSATQVRVTVALAKPLRKQSCRVSPKPLLLQQLASQSLCPRWCCSIGSVGQLRKCYKALRLCLSWYSLICPPSRDTKRINERWQATAATKIQ